MANIGLASPGDYLLASQMARGGCMHAFLVFYINAIANVFMCMFNEYKYPRCMYLFRTISQIYQQQIFHL